MYPVTLCVCQLLATRFLSVCVSVQVVCVCQIVACMCNSVRACQVVRDCVGKTVYGCVPLSMSCMLALRHETDSKEAVVVILSHCR